MADERTREEVIKDESKEADNLMTVQMHDDKTRQFRRVGLSRMKREWNADEAIELTGIHNYVDDLMLKYFGDAYLIINEIYEIVRKPVANQETGEILKDRHGFPLWERTESGAYVEDYSRMTTRDMHDYLFKITTRLFEWKQRQADLWGEAMLAKAVWEESFSIAYDESKNRTVEDKTQKARLGSREDRYFGILQAMVSRKADSLVSSLELLSQRLKDISLT